jgi:hypothetical protein
MQGQYYTGKALATALLLVSPLLLTGCVAAGAGAVAADAVVSPSEEAIQYVRTHDLKPYVGRAIERGDIVRGMSKEDVQFVKGDPRSIREREERTVWVYGTTTRIYFKNGEVVNH